MAQGGGLAEIGRLPGKSDATISAVRSGAGVFAAEGPQLEEFNHLLITEKYAELLPMATTWFEEGLKKGLEEGQQAGLEKGQRRTLTRQLEKKFGPLTPSLSTQFESSIGRAAWRN